MNNDAVEALTKLTEELTNRVDELEKENAELKKTASEKPAEPVKTEASSVVSASVVEATLDALHKVGMLQDDQMDESRRILSSDAEAPHRILQKILDAQSQTKVASEENISGGTLVGGPDQLKRDPMDDCFDRMERILKM